MLLQCSFVESERLGDKGWGGFLRVTYASKMSAPGFLIAKPVGCSRQGTEQSRGSWFWLTLHCDWRDLGCCVNKLEPGDLLMKYGAGSGEGQAAEKRGGWRPRAALSKAFLFG